MSKTIRKKPRKLEETLFDPGSPAAEVWRHANRMKRERDRAKFMQRKREQMREDVSQL